MSSKLSVLVSFLTLILVHADYGPCRYDMDRCSCKYGKDLQGVCWDKLIRSPGMCKRRYCKAGWTCSCGGRTHVCSTSKKSIAILKNPEDKDQTTAECSSKSVSLVTGREFLLGSLRIYLSKAGAAANDCNEVAWWLDGKLHGYHYAEDDLSNVNDILKQREEHSLLELKPNSLIAFRVKNGSYYCFKHYAEMVVNGVQKSTSSPGVTVHYSRKFLTDWYMPHYKLTPDRIGTDEDDALDKFLPLRKTKLSSAEAILPGKDYWSSPTGETRDTRRSNWYYRIQLTPTSVIV